MGGAFGMGEQPKRYMGGKLPGKFFKEDMWPLVADLFLKLNINEIKGFRLFDAFVRIDEDESGSVEQEESLKYFGGHRTKFTERLFYVPNNGEREVRGLEFKPWSIEVWSFCTLDHKMLARYAFEIFDIDRKDVLEKADIESMYRMLYDCDEPDPYFISQVPFDSTHCISKEAFTAFSKKNHHIIQPMIAYQRRLRRRIGSVSMWESLGGYRRRYFQAVDSGHGTLAEAVETIIVMDDPARKRKKEVAEALLREQTAKLEMETEMHERELRQHERQLAKERKMAARSAELTKMKKTWQAYQTKRKEFDETHFTVDDVWMRRELRLNLFTLLDEWNDASVKYWAKHDKNLTDHTLGTDADHEMRYFDFLNTPEGANLKQAVMLRYLFESIRSAMDAKKALTSSKQGNGGMSGEKVTVKDVEIKTCIEDLTAFIDGFDAPEAASDDAPKMGQKKRTVKSKGAQDALLREQIIVAKYSKPNDIQKYNNLSDEFLREHRKKALFDSTWAALNADALEREREFVRKKFDISTNLGSEITRWEYVFNPATEKMVYVNVDTLESIHRNSAICEKCDSIYEQFDLACLTCGMPRSGKNTRLYRPLGMKDIRVD